MVRKLVYILMLAVICCLTGCRRGTFETEYIGNNDAEAIYYSSYNIPIVFESPNSGIINSFMIGDNICVIASVYIDGEETYRTIMIDNELEQIISTNIIGIDHAYSFCATQGNNIACSTGRGFYIIDPYTGRQISEGQISGIASNERPSVAYYDKGFVFVTSEKIYRIKDDGGIIDSTELYIEGMPCINNTFFKQNGIDYVVFDEDMGTDLKYYKIDFDRGTVEQTASASQMDIVPLTAYENSKYAYDEYYGKIYELDIANLGKAICAYRSNMLIKPTTGSTYKTYIYNKDHFAFSNTYGGGMWELVVVNRDDDLNISDRTIITVAGDYATYDNSLLMAVYMYNTSQNEYYVNVESWGEESSWSTSAEAELRNLKLIQQMQNGDAPDILYGYTLDYDNMGQLGIVIDMMPYIENSTVITSENLNEYLYDLMTRNGQCYKLFNGFSFNGFCGSLVYDEDQELGFYTDSNISESLRFRYTSADYLNFILGYPLENLSHNDDFISEDQIERAISIATDIGIAPDEQVGSINLDGEENISYGIYGTVSSLERISDNGYFEFYGFPTLGETSYCINPMGLMAISSGSEHPEACFDFLEYMYSDEAQKAVLSNLSFPLSNDVYNLYMNYMRNPDSIPDNEYGMRLLATDLIEVRGNEVGYRQLPSSLFTNLSKAISHINQVTYIDFGLYNILVDEINSYYTQDKPISDIARSLRSRLLLYAQENYYT